MTQYVGRNTTERKVAGVRKGAREVAQKPYAGRWNTPNVDPDPPVAPLETGWAQPSDPDFEEFAYRLHMDGSPEFKGHVEIDGATSPSVVIILPDGDIDHPADPTYRVGKKQFFPSFVIDPGAPTAPEPAAFLYDPTTGELTVTWPYP